MFGIGFPELIVIAVLAGIPILVILFVRKKKETSAENAKDKLNGVSGWLLLFCLGLTVFGPLFTFGQIGSSYREALKYAHQFPGLMTITVIDNIVSLGLMAFSVFAGICLLRIRPKAVQTAKKYLLFLLGYFVFSAILPFTAGLPSAANDAMIPEVAMNTVKGIIYVAVWYAYLNKSQRVRTTYS